MILESWKNFMIAIKALNERSEDAHLNARGPQFYSIHEAMVKIQDGLSDDDTSLNDIPDLVQETVYGARGESFITSNELVKGVIEKLPITFSDIMDLILQVRDLLDDAISVLDEILSDGETSPGENDLAASLSRELQHRRYFLNAILS